MKLIIGTQFTMNLENRLKMIPMVTQHPNRLSSLAMAKIEAMLSYDDMMGGVLPNLSTKNVCQSMQQRQSALSTTTDPITLLQGGDG